MGINDKKLNNKRFSQLIAHTKEYLGLSDKVTVVAISKEEMKERSGFGRISVAQYTLETAQITYVKRKTGYSLGNLAQIIEVCLYKHVRESLVVEKSE